MIKIGLVQNEYNGNDYTLQWAAMNIKKNHNNHLKFSSWFLNLCKFQECKAGRQDRLQAGDGGDGGGDQLALPAADREDQGAVLQVPDAADEHWEEEESPGRAQLGRHRLLNNNNHRSKLGLVISNSIYSNNSKIIT